MISSEFEISRSVEKVMMKTFRKIAEIATLPKGALFRNRLRFRSQILIAQIEDLNQGCVKISSSYFQFFPRNKLANRITFGKRRIGPVHCFKSYMTVNRNI